MSRVFRPDRRDFLKATGLAGLALVLGVPLASPVARAAASALEPNVFVRLGADGSVRLTAQRSEMGQGIRTAIAMILADELDVPWEGIEVVQADGHPKYGGQSTGGSRSIREHFEPLRLAGATARAMLVAAAAARWGVDPTTCTTEPGQVVGPQEQRATYGDLVAEAAALPVPDDPPLKDPSQWRYIGTNRTNVDVPDMIRGTAVYGGDVRLPGMLFASLLRSPKVGGELLEHSDEAARAVPGVVDVVVLEPAFDITDAAVAVLAENTWAAMHGREKLKAVWGRGTRPNETTADYTAALQRAGEADGKVVRVEGDVDAALGKAKTVVEARYTGPHVAHAPMEPPVATARFENGRCEVWAPTQAPQWAREAVAELLDLATDDVTVHVTLLGGGFGRKSKPDYVLEAAALAKATGRPVQVVWTREDDLRHGFYRAQNFQYLKAGLDKKGATIAWLHRTAFPGIGWGDEGGFPDEGELGQGFTNLPFRVPNLRLEAATAPTVLRIGWFRSVCHTFHAFAINGFVDELAHAAGRDPVQYHLDLIGEPRIIEDEGPWAFDTGRLRGVIERVAKESGWGKQVPAGHGLGFAAHYSFHSYAAVVAHVSVQSGKLKVHEIHTAVDCGRVIHPDGVEAQMQGATAMGLSLALYNKITVFSGDVTQGNFDDYPVLRFPDMPQVHVYTVDSDRPPTGTGEPGIPPLAPAVVNALFAATGKRIRDLPLAGQSLG